MSDSDAWAKACAEDLEAEKARRRAERGADTGSAADEFRKLFEAVAEKVSGGLGNPLLAGQAAQTVQQLVSQAKAAVEPVIERNPQVFDHLAAAGSELLAAYRSAVESHESRWTRDGKVTPDDPRDPRRDAEGTAGDAAGHTGGATGGDTADGDRKDDEGPGTGQHIDLD
ncbi:hypothetical protein EAO70_21505 [Streptomyces sp. adm13(2018)]|uniref:DUF5304 domain-containing protein n=1 Tax=Streptomyces sp. adm13(2018) TaxID=2479007 RepID=UPI0011CDBA80|nr:DUF5304 domain-containing protein [Streptomyces sp. adm13(2018)]TXS14142.1 hypothetical protein EAO70_21505 [Streptomyces sp. adm13(2018)]